MGNKLFIKRFKISELFGVFNVNIPFNSNINIFVGENGLGKTTILNTLNYVITGDSESLSTIDFKKIELTLGNDKIIEINREDIIKNKMSSYESYRYVNYISDTEEFNIIEQKIMLEILKHKSPKILEEDKLEREKLFEKICKKYRYNFSPATLETTYNSLLKNQRIEKVMKESWEYQIYEYMKKWNNIIYLPTYRRIEEDFNSYIESIPDKEYYRKENKKRNLSYLQFGMDDVQAAIEKTCNDLKNNTNEGFKAMTSNLLTNYISINEDNDEHLQILNYKSFDASKLDIVFSRLADKIDTNIKTKIIAMVKNKKIKEDKYHQYLISIINELTNIYEKNQQIDNNLENFKEVCNRYLVNKQVEYNKFKIECNVIQKNSGKVISLKNLSSGEKQILSLFSKLYLNLEEKNVILFDEPELSLSILWQKKLIPDILNSNRCKFLAVITHSPFIFDNEFKDYAINIHDYIEEVKDGKNEL